MLDKEFNNLADAYDKNEISEEEFIKGLSRIQREILKEMSRLEQKIMNYFNPERTDK